MITPVFAAEPPAQEEPTLEYKLPIAATTTRLRMEYRYDDSTGSQGGFFKNGEISPGVIGLVQAQHLLIFAILWNYDSP
jgi:hypothetical protein